MNKALAVAVLIGAHVLIVAAVLAEEPHMHGSAQADADWYGQAKSSGGGPCCGNKDCRLSSYCSTATISEGIVIDGACIPLPYDRLVPAPAGVLLSPDEIHICWQRRATGISIVCVIGGLGA